MHPELYPKEEEQDHKKENAKVKEANTEKGVRKEDHEEKNKKSDNKFQEQNQKDGTRRNKFNQRRGPAMR